MVHSRPSKAAAVAVAASVVSGRGDTVLARTGFRYDARLADGAGEERLAKHVVDLVRARVVEVFAFEDDARSAGMAGKFRRLGDNRRAPGIRAA